MLRRLIPHRSIRNGIFLLILFVIPVFLILALHQSSAPPSFLLDHPYFQFDLDLLEPRDADDQRCVLPRVHPFDPSIWSYLYPSKKIVCKDKISDWTWVDEAGWLRFNESQLEDIGYEVGQSLKCFWAKVERGGATGNLDDEISYAKQSPLPREGIKLPDDVEILRVKCTNFANYPVYDRLHAHIRNATVPPAPERSHRNFVNVLIFGLDSLSRSAFIRHLPLTYKFLTEDLKMTVLRGMNKIADNTYPNLIGLLTGKEAYGGKLPDNSFGYDEWPIVWKNYSQVGYATLWAEDFPDFGTFTYLATGFHEPPALHYLRPYWLAMKDSPLLKYSAHMCYGSAPRYQQQIEYLKQFITTYASRRVPYFGFSFLAEISHEYMSRVSSADRDFLEFLQWLADSGQLDYSLLIVMSDHGHRFDPIRTTKVGHIEERTPFYAVRIPMTLTSRQPKILDNLLINSGRLVTPFDMYATLADLLGFVVTGRPVGQYSPPPEILGRSLFGQIPANRTCKDASIPPHYCICETASSIEISDPRASVAAMVTIQYINSLLKEEAHRCSPLTLRTLRAAQLVRTMEDSGTSSDEQKVRVVIEAEPSLALFEATVIVQDDSGEVWGDVSRINPYAGQSECIRHVILRKYCYCTGPPDADPAKDSAKL